MALPGLLWPNLITSQPQQHALTSHRDQGVGGGKETSFGLKGSAPMLGRQGSRVVVTAVALASSEEVISPNFEVGSIQKEFIKELLLGVHKLSLVKSVEETKISGIPHSNRDPESSGAQMWFCVSHTISCEPRPGVFSP